MTTAFVLSGGASLGAIQVGMLQALREAGVAPDLLIGSSVGAINAAWVAGNPEPDGLEALAAIWRGLRRATVFPTSPWLGAAAMMGRRNNLVRPDALRALLERNLPFRRLEEARIPLHVVATDLLSGRAVILSEGEAIPSLMASAAIPAIFPPVRIGGRDLIDGGVAENAPIGQAVRLGADRVFVLTAAHACELTGPPRSALAMALHSLNLMIEARLAADVERFGGEVELHVVPHPCPLAVSPADFSHGGELIKRARLTVRRQLAGRGHRIEGAGALLHGVEVRGEVRQGEAARPQKPGDRGDRSPEPGAARRARRDPGPATRRPAGR